MDYFARLAERLRGMPAEREFSFARHTTVGCGGIAALAVSPADTESAAGLLRLLLREKIPYCLLGAGANVLPPDGRFEGVVVRFHGINFLFSDENSIYAGAGVTGGRLCRFARGNGLGGFEFFTGIPATVGGATAMNAGVAECRFGERVERVVGVEEGKIRTFGPKDCAFGEKDSLFLHGVAVTGVYLKGYQSSAAQIARRTAYFREKRARLPKGRSMGCVFVNPEGDSAGRLVDVCGFKGYAVGGARVSELHANFILNEGGSAEDVARLIAVVKEGVFRKTGVLLREEIRRIGREDGT